MPTIQIGDPFRVGAVQQKLGRSIKDLDGTLLRTRADARAYMTALPERRARRSQWQRGPTRD